jgi:hypothetical protein
MTIWEAKEKSASAAKLYQTLVYEVNSKPFQNKLDKLIVKMVLNGDNFYDDCGNTYWADTFNELIQGYI